MDACIYQYCVGLVVFLGGLTVAFRHGYVGLAGSRLRNLLLLCGVLLVFFVIQGYGYRFGFGSAQTYTNDWLWLPLLIFGWLPILYFSRVTSIPEYFERRFDRGVRGWVTAFVLVYLVGYVGVNLFTMGKVLNILLGWPIWTAACVVATISAIYVTAGGQTSVIVPMAEAGKGLFAGMTQFKFMRAFFGLVVCLVIGVVTTLLTRPESAEKQRG